MGLGWDVAKKKGFFGFGGGSVDIDLDTSCLMFDEARANGGYRLV
jgi:tellurium resistance protein TerZ